MRNYKLRREKESKDNERVKSLKHVSKENSGFP